MLFPEGGNIGAAADPHIIRARHMIEESFQPGGPARMSAQSQMETD